MDKNIFAVKIGSNIKELRESLGLSQNDLASRTGCSFSQISKYERGLNVPRGETIERIAAALKVPKERITSVYDPKQVCEPVNLPYDGIPRLTEKEQALLDFIRKFSEDEQDRMIKEIREKAIKALTGEN